MTVQTADWCLSGTVCPERSQSQASVFQDSQADCVSEILSILILELQNYYKQQTCACQVKFVQSVLNLRPQPLRIHKLTASLKYKLPLILDFEEQQTKSSAVVHYILNLRPRDTPAHIATEINNILLS